MKKPANTRIGSNAKAPGPKRKRKPNAMSDDLRNLDGGALLMLREMLAKELGVAPELFGGGDVVGLFKQFLKLHADGEAEEEQMLELAEGLGAGLNDLRISANGGDRDAREKIQAIQRILHDALESRSMGPVALVMTGKVLAEAEWTVPEALKRALVEAAEAAGPTGGPGADGDIVSTLLEVAEQTNQNPFEVHAYMNSLMASFPPEVMARLLFELVDAKNPVIAHAVAGFVLHPEIVIAHAAAEALEAFARQTSVESLLVERLVRMRPWLPPLRQTQIDAAIRVLRSDALAPVTSEPRDLLKCGLSIRDGSGAQNLFATLRTGRRFQIATVLMKPAGVVDALILPDLSKSAMDDISRQMKSNAPMMETDLAGVTGMLELAIADNVASGTLPPFKFVEALESMGVGAVHPNPASSLEIINDLLADLPPGQTDGAAVAKAHGDIFGRELEYQWFEAGEEVEAFLAPIKGSKKRVTRFLADYLPRRRLFWARQCAISALAMRGLGKAVRSPWKTLALVGRDIASDVPLDQIPLMKQVARASIKAFEWRG